MTTTNIVMKYLILSISLLATGCAATQDGAVVAESGKADGAILEANPDRSLAVNAEVPETLVALATSATSKSSSEDVESEFRRYIHIVTPFTQGAFSDGDWIPIFEAAKLLQSMPMERAVFVLSSLCEDISTASRVWPAVYLVNRVVFDGSKGVDRKKWLDDYGNVASFGGWRLPPELPSGRLDVEWPLYWKDGVPMVDNYHCTYNGSDYDGGMEFAYRYDKLKFRKLD